MGRQEVSIEESVVLDCDFPSVGERYYTHYYYVPKQQLIKAPPQQPPIDHQDVEIPCKRLKLEDGVAGVTLDQPQPMEEDDHTATPHVNTPISATSQDGAAISTPPHDGISTPEATSAGGREYLLTGTETLVMIHSNKLCVVSLSPHHPVVRNSIPITKVEYTVHGCDRLNNKVSGKGKRGAQVMGSKATLCRLHAADGRTYDVTCGARGKLLQVNEQLLSQPDLARTALAAEGFLGIVQSKLQDHDQLLSALMPAALYRQAWAKQHDAAA